MNKYIMTIIMCMLVTPSIAETNITISKTYQMMQVDTDTGSYQWPVSTARKGYNTPTGTFYPHSLQPMHYSKKFNNAPMPYSIFFDSGYAIHGTSDVNHLGRPASHGCVRLRTDNAKTLYGLVQRDRRGTTIRIVP